MGNIKFRMQLALLLWLTFLSQPSLVLAWSEYETADPITVGGATVTDKIDNVGERQYRWFNLAARGNISLKFTHVSPDPLSSSRPAWKIQLEDEIQGTLAPFFSTTSNRLDNGIACSAELQPGKYYLLIEGLKDEDKVPPEPLSLFVEYYLDVSQKNLNVKLLRADKQMEGSYPTIAAAYNHATAGSTIRSTCSTIKGDVTFNNAIFVMIEGGQDGCFSKSQANGYTTIEGLLTVSNGTVRVKGLKLRSPT